MTICGILGASWIVFGQFWTLLEAPRGPAFFPRRRRIFPRGPRAVNHETQTNIHEASDPQPRHCGGVCRGQLGTNVRPSVSSQGAFWRQFRTELGRGRKARPPREPGKTETCEGHRYLRIVSFFGDAAEMIKPCPRSSSSSPPSCFPPPRPVLQPDGPCGHVSRGERGASAGQRRTASTKCPVKLSNKTSARTVGQHCRAAQEGAP